VNWRDYATLEQLIVVTNLESINALLIRQGHIQKLKEDGSASNKFNKENFDLITWFIVSKE